MRYHITISGMGCAHCVKSVTEALTAIGATVERCEVGSADVAFDGTTAEMTEAVADHGFDVTAITEA